MTRMRGWLIALSLFTILITGYLSSGAMAQERRDQWIAQVVSAQGKVQARSAGNTEWLPARQNDDFCPGDTIRVGERSRAAIRLPNETILRLDQNTTITFSGLEKKRTSLLDLLRGAVHFFSRTPQG
ncbi:MAG: FecR domain-containing protein, partial [Proteobacteria bacterium]|nr:FecR domain-containing protein [Pseudomonadota bacterium]